MFFFFHLPALLSYFFLFYFFQASDPSVCLFDRRAARFKVWWIFKFKKFICAFLSWTLCMLIRTAGWTGHSFPPAPWLYFPDFPEKQPTMARRTSKRVRLWHFVHNALTCFLLFFFRFLFINIVWYMHVFICFEATKCGKAARAEGKQIKIAHIKRNFLFVLSWRGKWSLGCFY